MPTRRGEKWEARLKLDGRVVKTRRFDTKRAAVDWERRQRAAFDEHGFDPTRGRISVADLLAAWLEQRAGKVSDTTLNTDRFLLPTTGQRSGKARSEPVLPTWLRSLHAVNVTGAAITKWQDDLTARGLAPTTVKRYRESLSSFFTWCVTEGYVATNPVAAAAPPKDDRARDDMRPLPADEFDTVVDQLRAISPVYADLVHVLGRTGLRWGEARALLVRDVAEFPMPLLHVVRNQPEGIAKPKSPKSRKGRRVPLPDSLLPVIRRFTAGKNSDDLLFTRPGGGQLHRSMFIRATDWARIGKGRTLHDLRHTAACEWITQGVPLTTVQAWLGHGSIAITSRYLHHLGDFADRAALELLNHNPPPPPEPARRTEAASRPPRPAPPALSRRNERRTASRRRADPGIGR